MADSIGHTKKALVQALEKSLGVVSTACKAAGISRDTHYRWLKEDPDYKAQEIAVAEKKPLSWFTDDNADVS